MRAVSIVMFVATTASADAPCKRCVLDAPASADPVPLLVVLHGDRASAATAAKRWRAATKKRGWAMLSLQCPKGDSWWKWNGDPQWIREQIAALAIDVDPARTYVAGWSGGATYLGMHARAWTDMFAALVIHGGGHRPDDDACPPRALPAYFLVGDKNPLHAHVIELHEYLAGCEKSVVWDLVKGGDHEAEHKALDAKKALAVLDWLAEHPRE